jgi:hypothetical protein
MRPLLSRILPLLAALVIAAVGSSARAQTPDRPGVVEGRAVTEEGAPLGFALVRLIPLGPRHARSMLTRGDGRFRFTGVAPGSYRLRLERIGFETETSDPLTVESGGTATHTFRSAPRPVVIEGVTGAAACYTGDRLERDRELASLWREAQKAMEIKRAFDREYIYSYDMVQRTRRELVPERRGDTAAVRHDSLRTHVVNDPRQRRAWRNDWRGYGLSGGVQLYVRVPDGTEILDPAFLRRHCLDSGFEAAGDVWEFDFRPVRPDPSRFELRGTVRIDRQTFELRAMELEYMKGAEPFLKATIDFRDARVPGGKLRLPVLITFSGRPVEGAARVVRRVEGTVEYTGYTYFQTPVDELRR